MRLCLWLVKFVEWRINNHWERVEWNKRTQNHHRVCSVMDGLAQTRMYLQLIVED